MCGSKNHERQHKVVRTEHPGSQLVTYVCKDCPGATVTEDPGRHGCDWSVTASAFLREHLNYKLLDRLLLIGD